jgi:hypothetical protein
VVSSRAEAFALGLAHPGLGRQLVARHDDGLDALEQRIAGLRRVGDRALAAGLQAPGDARRPPIPDPEPIDDGAGVGEGAGVGDGRAGGDHVERVADDVREHQRQHVGRRGQPGEPAALRLLQVLADRVQLVDRRAGP